MSAYLSAVVADTPLHYWRLADPGGKVANDIGSTRVPMLCIQGNAEVLGYSGPVSDGGSEMSCGNTHWFDTVRGLAVPSTWSIECIVWIFGIAAATGNFWWGWGDATTGPALQTTGNTTQFQLVFNGAATPVGTNLTFDVWHHLVATYDGANLRFYVDGSLYGGPTAASSATPTAVFQINRRNSGGQQPAAGFAEVAIYSTALSAARVSAHNSAIDQDSQSPVYSGASGAAAAIGGVDPAYNGAFQELLKYVAKTFSNHP